MHVSSGAGGEAAISAGVGKRGSCTDLIADRLADMVPIMQVPPGMQHEFETFCKAPSVAAMELTSYRVCVTEYNRRSKELVGAWETGQDATSRMYRIVKN